MKNTLTLLIISLMLVSCTSQPEEVMDPNTTVEKFVYTNGSKYDTLLTTSFYYPEFAKYDFPEAVRDSIMAFILHSDWASSTAIATTAEEVFFGVKNDYQDLQKEFEDYNQTWSLKRRAAILFQSPQFISLCFEETRFLGGAHPTKTQKLITFDLKQTTPISLKNLVFEGMSEKLTAAGESVFRKERELDPEESLVEAGFFFDRDRFYLTSNFAVVKKGIRFLYNPYEIAPYYLGSTDMLLEWKDIQNYIKIPEVNYTETTSPKTELAKSPV